MYFEQPTNSGPKSAIPEQFTGPETAEIRRAHVETHDEFTSSTNMGKASKTQLIPDFDKIHTCIKRNNHVGYARATTL